MDEAEALCDRVLIDRSAVTASGTPDSVKRSILVGPVRFALADCGGGGQKSLWTNRCPCVWEPWLVLAWCVVLGWLAARWFRWE